jgi:hypothetical protein
MKNRALVICLGIVLSCFLFAGNAFAVFYTCIIDKVVSRSDSQVRLQILPGTGETRFTALSRIYVDTSKAGGKNMLATILTAVSLGAEVTFDCAKVPDYNDPVEETVAVGLVSP